jgi:hypothetical protein
VASTRGNLTISEAFRTFRTASRFLLAAAMLYYAARAFLRIEPSPSSPELLARTLGSLQPHELLANMLGHSYRLAVFIGINELIAAVLLLRAKTALLGALISVLVLSNVIAMGFFFAVPGWYFSVILLALAAVVILPEGMRLSRLHLTRGPVEPSSFAPLAASSAGEPSVSSVIGASSLSRWAKRFGFYTLFAYSILYTLFSEPIGWVVNSWRMAQSIFAEFVVFRLAPAVSWLPIPPIERYTGNFWHVIAWGCLVLAPIIGLIWSFINWRRTDFTTLYRWLRTIVRFVVASMMFDYAFIKFSGAQVWPPTIAQMTRTVAEFQPSALLFFGTVSYSYGYMVFTGLGELTGGLLLLSRRTATLGALILFPLLLNVTLFNIFYDIGVEDRSAPLLLFTVIIFAQDIRRLVDAYILNRAIPPAQDDPPVLSGGMRWALKLLILSTFVMRFYAHVTGNALMAPDQSEPMMGSYAVDSFAINGVARQPIPTDTVRWMRMDVEPYGRLTIARMDGSERVFRAAVDSTESQIMIFGGMPAVRGAARWRAPMSYDPNPSGYLLVSHPGPTLLHLDGIVENDTVSVRLHELRDRDFPLMKHATFLSGQRRTFRDLF